MKENSSDFRKRLHKRAHLNFSNSPAFHFPDGRSFVRTTRLLRALVSFAGSSRLTMAAAFRNASRKVLHDARILHPPTSSSPSCSLRPPRRCLVRRRELSRCEPDLKLSPYIRSFSPSFPSSGVVNRAGDLALALVVWSSSLSVPRPMYSVVTTKEVDFPTTCSLLVLFFEQKSFLYFVLSYDFIFSNGYFENQQSNETDISDTYV